MLRVYIAAPFEERVRAQGIRDLLERAAVDAAGVALEPMWVTSRWLTDGATPQDDLLTAARMDLADVASADVLLLVNPRQYAHLGTGGRHVETGFALALHKPVVMFGAVSNVFHELPEVRVVTALADLPSALRSAVEPNGPPWRWSLDRGEGAVAVGKPDVPHPSV